MVDERANPVREPQWLSAGEQALWRSLMRTAFELGWALEHQLQREAGLSLTEYYTLAMLSEQPDRRMRMSELANLTQSSLSRLSHLVKRLESRTLVRREPDPTDGRYTFAILSNVGFALLESAAPAHVETVRRLVVDAVGADRLAPVSQAADAVQETVDGYRRVAGAN